MFYDKWQKNSDFSLIINSCVEVKSRLLARLLDLSRFFSTMQRSSLVTCRDIWTLDRFSAISSIASLHSQDWSLQIFIFANDLQGVSAFFAERRLHISRRPAATVRFHDPMFCHLVLNFQQSITLEISRTSIQQWGMSAAFHWAQGYDLTYQISSGV